MRKVKSERLSPLPDENSSDHPSRSCVNENAVKDELSAAVSRALSSLPAPYRLAVTLCDIEGRKNSEAAAMLGLSLPALKARLHRGRLMSASASAHWPSVSADIISTVPSFALSMAVH